MPTQAARHAHSWRRVRIFSLAALTCLTSGLLTVLAGWLLPPFVSSRLQAAILQSVLWTPNAPPDVQQRYTSNVYPGAPPAYLSVWMMNITNLDGVRAGEKPVLEQVGPFVHRSHHDKLDVLWDAQGRVHFKDYSHFTFEPALSGADGSAPIATLNLALLGVLAALRGTVSPSLLPWADLLLKAISSFDGDPDLHGLFLVKPAMQLLWGYEDKLLALLTSLLPPGTLPHDPMVSLLQNASSPDVARARNATVYDTGERDLDRIWNIVEDRGHANVTSWPCVERVRGSDATQFHPGVSAHDKLTVWVGDIFQAIELVANTTVELHGVQLLRFGLPPPRADPCHDAPVPGLMNITSPQALGWDGPRSPGAGPPLLVSQPMFCGTEDPSLTASLDGLPACDPDVHMTWVDVEPTTGVTLRAAKRLMVSSQLSGLGASLEPHVPGNLTLPIMWAQEAGEATPALAARFSGPLHTAHWLAVHLGTICYLVGGSLLLVGVVLASATVELAADRDSCLLSAARRVLLEDDQRGDEQRGVGNAQQRLIDDAEGGTGAELEP